MKTYVPSADQRGAALVEYALLVALLAIGLVGGLTVLGNTTRGAFESQSETLAIGPQVAGTDEDNGTDDTGNGDSSEDGDTVEDGDEGETQPAPDFGTLADQAASVRGSGTWTIDLLIEIEASDDSIVEIEWSWTRPNGTTGSGTLSCDIEDGACTTVAPSSGSFDNNVDPVVITIDRIGGVDVPVDHPARSTTVSR